MKKLNVFVLSMLLLFSVSYAAVSIGKGKLVNIDYTNGQAVYTLSKDAITADITTKKLSNSKYEITVGSAKFLDFEMLNPIDYAKNKFLDCTGGYTCDMKIRVKASQAMRFAEGQISGGWKDGQATIEKIFYLRNITAIKTGTTISGGNYSYEYTKTYEETDLDTLTISKYKYVDLYIRFTRTELKEVDIYPIIFGHEYTDWSNWGVGGNEYTVIINGTKYTIHEFTSTGTLNITKELTATVLIVGGGGAGAPSIGGGGGGGEVYINTSFNIPSGNYTISIGDGGVKPTSYPVDASTDGQNTSIEGLYTALGGGGGNGYNNIGRNGASGGGGGGNRINNAGNGTVQYDGGNGTTSATWAGGGGGGAGSQGLNGAADNGGNGGAGKLITINGSNVYYGGGGGGGVFDAIDTVGTGGTGGGGDGGASTDPGAPDPAATAGTANTGGGGGGGGGSDDGAAGGSGIVIIRYASAEIVQSPAVNPAVAFANTTMEFNTTFTDLETQNITSVNWTIYVNGTVYRTNQTNGLWANDSVSLWNESGFLKGDILIFQVAGRLTNGTWLNDTNSSSVTIQNYNITITELNFTTNGSAYLLGEVEANVTVEDIDTADTLTLTWNFFKNGANQTALADSKTVTSGAVTTINANQSTYTEGDNWSIRVWATDGTNTTPYNDSSNTTIQNYLTSITKNSTSPQYDTKYYPHYLNATQGGASGTIARVLLNGVWTAASATLAGSNYNYSVTLLPPIVAANTIYLVTWELNTTTPNGSIVSQNQTYNITVAPGGVFVCNASNTQQTAKFEIYNATTLTSINATTNIVLFTTRENGLEKSTTISSTNQTFYLCLSPQNQTYSIRTTEQYSGTGYSPVSVNRTLTASNTSQNISIYLYSTSVSTITQLKVINSPNLPVENALITIDKYIAPDNYTHIASCQTTSAGTCSAYLYPNMDYYRYTITVLGVNTTFGPEVLTCSALSATCYRTFTLGSAGSYPAYLNGTITGSCTYTNTTNTLSCSGSDSSNVLTTLNLKLFQSGKTTALCTNTSATTNATLTCIVPNLNTTFTGVFYGLDAEGNYYIISSDTITELNTWNNRYGPDAWLAVLVIFSALVFSAFASLWLGLALGIFGIGIAVILGFAPLGPLTPIVIGGAVIVGIAARKLKV